MGSVQYMGPALGHVCVHTWPSNGAYMGIYEIGVGEVVDQAYKIGDLERTVAGAEDGSEWKPAGGILEVVVGGLRLSTRIVFRSE